MENKDFCINYQDFYGNYMTFESQEPPEQITLEICAICKCEVRPDELVYIWEKNEPAHIDCYLKS